MMNKNKIMEIILPPFEDIDDEGNYIGNDIIFLKQQNTMNKNKIKLCQNQEKSKLHK